MGRVRSDWTQSDFTPTPSSYIRINTRQTLPWGAHPPAWHPAPTLFQAAFVSPSSQPLSFVFHAHAFQTAKRCVFFYKKFIYESCLKIKLIYFFKKLANS
jgi:hypothetical protein